MHYSFVSILLIIFIYDNVIAFDDFVDCGGFIRPSKQLSSVMEEKNIKMDYSKDVRVHLLTLDGIKKFSAECAPNGYYIIPVYDKGTFILRIEGPQGWVFLPDQVSVTIQGNGQCSQDFELTGFSVQGKVVGDANCDSKGKAAPQGITLKLTPLNTKTDIETQTTISSLDGSYKFSNTFPGDYLLEASHPEWTFQNQKLPFVATWGNHFVEENFVVLGYGIYGRVLETSETGEPVQGVNFFLYSETITKLDCPDVTEIAPVRKNQPLCSVKTDTTGSFTFSNVPCGKYTLVPFYTSTHTTYDVIPKEVDITIDQATLTITNPFLVKGFSVRGRVVGANSEGIEGVLVKAITEGFERTATTDTSGEYILDQITSGEYTISADKVHHSFSTLTKYKISPTIAHLTDIVASRYQVCGRVSIPHPPAGVSVEKRKISLDPVDKSTPPQTTKTDQAGTYCIAALPGKYTISPDIQPEEIEAGLLLTETSFEVVVDSLPVLDVNFEQARLTVSGRVRCIESPCDTSISVSLSAIGRASRVTTGLAIGHDDSSGEDHFIFKGVLPGKYEVTINHENWCWEKENEIVEVTTKDQNDIQFVQTGYVLVVKTSHDVDLMSTADDEEKTFKLVKGKNTFCLPKPGIYRFTPQSCYRFESDSYTYDTTKPNVIKLNAQYYSIQGQIRIPQVTNPPLPPVLPIAINVTANDVLHVITAEKSLGNYTFTYWAELGQKLVFAPVSDELFFYPQTLTASVEKSECPPALPPFDARPGMYLSGIISPASVDVEISVLFSDTGLLALPVLKTLSDGSYKAGPLYDDRKYTVHAEKGGYHLKQVVGNPGNFIAQKLGRVDVTVTYQDSPVAGVLLSLSGTEGYKNNNATDSSGTFHFRDLFPGEYYLRPILKEYVFTPGATSITILEGDTSNIRFTATRVAYSCFGKVTTLNGDPEKGVTIEAIGPDNLYEETQSDASGTFRLRGLIPQKTYMLRVKLGPKNTRLSRAEPYEVPVTISESDVEDINFIVFRKSAKYDIIGTVNTDDKILPTLSVQIISSEDNKLIAEQPLGPSNFFNFDGLDGAAEYIVKLKTDLSERLFVYKIPEEKVSNLAKQTAQPTKITLTFESTERKIETEVENGSFGSLLFAIFVGICIYYHKIVTEFFKQFMIQQKDQQSDNDYGSLWRNKGKKKPKTKVS